LVYLVISAQKAHSLEQAAIVPELLPQVHAAKTNPPGFANAFPMPYHFSHMTVLHSDEALARHSLICYINPLFA
jgi:hypothetical protein